MNGKAIENSRSSVLSLLDQGWDKKTINKNKYNKYSEVIAQSELKKPDMGASVESLIHELQFSWSHLYQFLKYKQYWKNICYLLLLLLPLLLWLDFFVSGWLSHPKWFYYRATILETQHHFGRVSTHHSKRNACWF